MLLSEKKILVVGGSSALDRTIIGSLVKEGAHLVICDKNSNDCYDYDQPYIEFDIFDNSEIEANVVEIVQKFGKFDGFLFNIVHSDFRPLKTVKHDNLLKIMNENYFSFINFLRTLIKNKALNDGASVVGMSSISSIKAMKAKMAFCSAKAALDASIRCLAVEFAPKKIRINSIRKGMVEEDFEKSHIQSITSINEGSELDKQPLGLTSGSEIANVVILLLSDKTRTITGSSILIDGGYTS